MPLEFNARPSGPRATPLAETASHSPHAPSQTPRHNARITLVLLTYNRCEEVLRTLARLTALPDGAPIVVVDNASADDSAARIAAAFPEVKVVRNAANLGAAGRNAGVAEVRTDYVAFCDDDTWWAAGSLARAVSMLDEHPRVAALVARIVVEPDGYDDPVSTLMSASALDRDGLPGPALLGFMAGASVFRAAAFREVGGYEARFFIGGEEELVTLDLVSRGWSIVYAEDLTVHHHPSAMRDARGRRHLLARNALWVGWLRLPWRSALGRTGRTLREMARNGSLLRDGLDALRGLPWALRHRQVIPPYVEQMRQVLARSERR